MKRTAVLAVLSAFVQLMPVMGQEAPPDAAAPPVVGQSGNPNTWRHEQMQKLAKAQTAERRKQLKEDTEKLLKLATELKEQVDKSNEHVLSLEVVRKAEEIEKLAKHVKTNMRDEMR